MKIEDIVEGIMNEYARVKEMALEDLEIDDTELDQEAINVPSLYAKYLNEYFDASRYYMQLKEHRDKLYLERWRYYMGKQDDKYYARHPLNEKVIKTDIDKYLKADSMITKMDYALNLQKSLADYLENIAKEIQRRGYHIKSAIDFMKFQQGEY